MRFYPSSNCLIYKTTSRVSNVAPNLIKKTIVLGSARQEACHPPVPPALTCPPPAGLVDVIIYSSPDDKKKNRGFCFLEYESHKAASLAKR